MAHIGSCARSVAITLAASFLLFSLVSAQTSPLPVGYFCGPDTQSIVDGQYYLPQTDACVYLSHSLSFGPRVGDLFRGTVGSSTLVTGHGIGAFGATSTQFGDFVSAVAQGVQEGEDMFVAIYRDFNGSQFNTFRNYFRTGVGAPPHQDYGFIRFKWGIPPPPEPDEPDPVIIIPGILGSEKNSDGEWVIDPILHTYDDLIATLDVNHYTPGVDLFTLPYNWRTSNVETAALLKAKIDEVKTICNCDKVDLVAHSMGGLAARYYIQSDAYEQDVDQLIFLGTPHLGAPKAYLMWEGGLSGLDWQDAPFNFILSQEAGEEGYSDVLSYVRSKPITSVQELLPIHDYIFHSSSLRDYPSDYPVNSFLENLNDAAFDELDNSGIRAYNFVGDSSILATIVGINVIDTDEVPPEWEHGEPDQSAPFVLGNGDGTVALPSASFINTNLIIKNSSHRILPTIAESEIFEILTGDVASTLVNNPDIINFKLLLIKILSPADLLVIDANGNKIGKENGQAINQIPNAFYTGFNTDTEYITILNPLDGDYKIYTEGTDAGSYTVETAYISEESVVEASFTGNTLPGLVTELNVPIDNQNPQLNIQPTDTESPIISLSTPEERDYLRSEVLHVNIAADDTDSGLHSLETKLDNVSVPNVGEVDLFFHSLGNHSLKAVATDNVNNEAVESRPFKIIANATSTRSDMSRAHSLSWMTQKVYDDLKKKFDACFKKKTVVTSVIKTITVNGKNGMPTTKKVTEKVTKVEIYFDKKAGQDMLKTLDKYRGKGLNEQGYQLLKEDTQWLINN